MVKKISQYDSSAIEILRGLEPVKKRPGMYTDISCPNHLLQEVIDNSVDEVTSGFANKIEIVFHSDGYFSVRDNGRGMPTDFHSEEGVSGVEVIMTKLHAGGKFSDKNYKFSGGLHGVGVSVVNALSKHLIVEVSRKGKIHKIEFVNGAVSSPLSEVAACPKNLHGTFIKFLVDDSYFDSEKIDIHRLNHLLKAKAVLCPNLTITLLDEVSGKSSMWHFENGLNDYFLEFTQNKVLLPANGISEVQIQDSTSNQTFELVWIFAWSVESVGILQESFVNLIPTQQGGTHVNAFRQGVVTAVREFCKLHNILPRGLKVLPEDICSNLNYILSLKMAEPQFMGQTKEKLSSNHCASFISTTIKDKLSIWLNSNVALGKEISNQIISQAQNRIRSSQKVERKKTLGGPALPGKLSDCLSRSLDKTELFLVEGDSAGGSAKQARDKNFQAIMPLRGKILNSWETANNNLLANKEISSISTAIGVKPGGDITGLRYGKICILADADSDGAHIATLLIALFVRHFPNLVKNGNLYVALPPLYRIDAGKKTYYTIDELEKDKLTKKLSTSSPNTKLLITRFKGLGEMNPKQLRETAMNPETRKLVTLDLDEDSALEVMDMLLAKKRSDNRKLWLEDIGNLAVV